MKVYNTLTRKKEELVPITPGEIKMYACGPTVYNYIHIGNARPLCIFDILRRYLEYCGYNVKFVQNFTDIDDKIIRRANEEHVDFSEISERYIKEFWTDADGLNVRHATINPKATENIDAIIQIISTLIEKGYAYEAQGDVYFSTEKFKDYGKLSHQPLEDLEAGARIMVGEVKREPMDFAVWKAAKPGEPAWDSPWGKGRPGWHIECSGISMKYNGEYLDLHCGGIDNASPHHTNEIAQSESYLGHPWCPQWCHVAHLNTEGGKMSKSKGEFLTVSLLEQKGYDPLAYRFFCLQSHYRKSLVFTWENLDNAVAAYNKLLAKIAALTPGKGDVDPAALEELKARFTKAMDNDLNTSMAVTVLYDVLKARTTDATKLAALDSFDQVLGLKLTEKAAALRKTQAAAPAAGGFTVVCEDGGQDPQVEALIRARADAKKAKNFAEADRIRDDLKAQGVEITDVPGGVRWKRA